MSTAPLTVSASRTRFPGLALREILILIAWLRLHESKYDRIEGNVRVGKGVDPGPSVPDYIRQMAVLNSQKRIDAVAWKGTAVTLIEVKQRAKMADVGQLLGYQVLWQQDHPGLATPSLLIVAVSAVPEIEPLLKAQHVGLELVVPPSATESV